MGKQDDSTDNILETYFRQMNMYPLLNFEEELELSQRIKSGDTNALHKLINANLRLVVKIARTYTTQDSSLMDIIQEGNMGLMHAAEKYSHLKNVRFCTYASWWIRQYIARYLTNRKRMVRLPGRKEEILRKVQHAYHTLSQTLMHQPKTEEIAKELGISVREINSIVNMSYVPLCLEGPSNNADGSSSVVDVHADYTYCPERTLLKQFSRDNTRRFIDTLKDRERRVLTYRYQLDGGEHYTLKKISDKMGISPETVRQIEMKALKKMRSRAHELRNCVFLEAM